MAVASLLLVAWLAAVPGVWPPGVETVSFVSPADGSEQKTLLFLPPGDEPVPLLVAFHTWSGDYRQDESPYAAWCIARGWALAHPDLRGPANRLERARLPFPLDINTGIHDGHTGSVPVGHAVRAFNAVAAEAERIPAAAIAALERDRVVDDAWRTAAADPLYRARPVLLRRRSGATRLTIFDGGHEILHEAALTWLEAQRRGTAATWEVKPHEPAILARPAAPSGR